jgi:hypothetical protein
VVWQFLKKNQKQRKFWDFWKRIKNKEYSEILIDGGPLGRNEGNLLLSIDIEQWPFCVSFSNSNFMSPKSIGFISP